MNNEISKYFKVLSNPVRLDVFILVLDSSCDCDLQGGTTNQNCVTKIAKTLKIPQPTVSNHVKALIKAGLIENKRRGKNIFLFPSKTFGKQLGVFSKYITEKTS